MGEPVGLNMSLDDLIKKRQEQGGRGGGPGGHRGGGRGGGLGVRGGGVQKFDRNRPQQPAEQGQRQGNQGGFQHRGGFGGRGNFGGGSGGGGFGGGRRGGFAGRGGGFVQPPPPPPRHDVQTYLDDDTGNVVVRLKDTEIVTVSPEGSIVLNTGGWFTQTTLDTMNKALNVLQIRVNAHGDVREGSWQVAYGPHLLRFYDGLILHPKNPATAAQRAPMVLAAMSGAAAVTGAPGGGGGGMIIPAAAAALGTMGGGNPLAASAAAASTAAALAAGVMARARAALGLPSGLGGLGGLGQQGGYGGGLTAQQELALAGLGDAGGVDPDVIRRLKAQGRL